MERIGTFLASMRSSCVRHPLAQASFPAIFPPDENEQAIED